MEIEIKLGPLTEPQAMALFRDAGLSGDGSPARTIRMRTTYFDTPEGDFARSRQTLRLRQEDEVTLCTFKTALQGISRMELECPAATLEEGVSGLLSLAELPENARALLMGSRLIPACGAAFTRHTRRCIWEGLTFDLCADVGVLFADCRQEPLCEVELELVSGEPAALEALAEQLCRQYAAARCHTSKQQRALALRSAP